MTRDRLAAALMLIAALGALLSFASSLWSALRPPTDRWNRRDAKNRLFHGDRLDLDEQGRRTESFHVQERRGGRRRRQQPRPRPHETFQQAFVG